MGISALPMQDFNAMTPSPNFEAIGQQAYQEAQQRQVQQAQLARAVQQQHQLDAARASFIQNPTGQNVRALAALDPQGFAAIKDAHTQQTSDQQNQSLRDLSAIRGHLQVGNTAGAVAVLNNRIQADSAAGQDTTTDQQMLDQINRDPKTASGLVDYALAGAMGPDKWAETYGKTQDEARLNTAAPGQLALTAAQTAQAQADAAKATQETANLKDRPPETAVTTGADGQPIFYNKNAAPPANGVAGAAGGSPALSGFVDRLQGSENATGNSGAKNPNSSATGNGQFINSTWLKTVKSVMPDVAAGKTDAQILAMRSDPALSRQVTTAYAQQNAATLGGAGLPVNGATLAMAHKLGPGDAQVVLGADPSTPLRSILSAPVIAANPQLAKLTAGQYAQGLASQFGTDPINPAADPSATGEDFLATLSPARAKMIRAMANGDLAMPSGRSATAPGAQAIVQQVLQYDPTASAINLATRQETRKKFTSGTEGQAINSLNTVTGHLVGLDHAIDALNNTPIGIFNKPAQVIGEAVGDKGTQRALANFAVARTNVANELTKVFRGSNGAESDIKGWMAQLDSAKSPVELKATVHAMVDSMQSRIQALTDQYNVGMGKVYDTVPGISPHTKALLASLSGQGSPAVSGPPPAAVAYLKANPQTAGAFDAQFGAGASRHYVGSR